MFWLCGMSDVFRVGDVDGGIGEMCCNVWYIRQRKK